MTLAVLVPAISVGSMPLAWQIAITVASLTSVVMITSYRQPEYRRLVLGVMAALILIAILQHVTRGPLAAHLSPIWICPDGLPWWMDPCYLLP